VESEEALGALAVADQWIEGAEHAQAFRRLGQIAAGIAAGEDEGRARLAAFRALDAYLLQLVALARVAPFFGFLRRHQTPEGGDLAGGGDTQTLERRAAGPVDGFVVAGFGRQVFRRDGPLGEVVDLLEAVARGHRQVSATPEEFQCRFRGMPVPPAAVGLGVVGIVVADFARQHAAVLGDVPADGLDLGLEALAMPVPPARPQPSFLAGEAPLPIREESAGDDRGVVGPVLEQRRLALVQAGELLVPIGLVAREKDHVVGALDGLDRVHLHEAQVFDQLQQVPVAQLAVRRKGQPLALQEQPSRVAVVEEARRAHESDVGSLEGSTGRLRRQPPRRRGWQRWRFIRWAG
jgi:hypothetical protein